MHLFFPVLPSDCPSLIVSNLVNATPTFLLDLFETAGVSVKV